LLREGRREAKVKAKIKGLASESHAEALRLRSGQALLILDG